MHPGGDKSVCAGSGLWKLEVDRISLLLQRSGLEHAKRRVGELPETSPKPADTGQSGVYTFTFSRGRLTEGSAGPWFPPLREFRFLSSIAGNHGRARPTIA